MMKNTLLALLFFTITLNAFSKTGRKNNPVSVLASNCTVSGTIESENVSCSGGNNGLIVIRNSSGAAVYEYSVNNGGSWQRDSVFSNLSAGNFTVLIRDSLDNSCTVTLNPSLAITEPSPLDATISTDEINCNPTARGTIYFKLNQGGSGNYQFSIDGGSTWQDDSTFSNLEAQTYNLVMRDASDPGCTKSFGPQTIIQPDPITASNSKIDVNCYGMANGSISITVDGSFTNYQYSKNNGSSYEGAGAKTHTFSGLTEGTYYLKVKATGTDLPECVYTFDDPVVIDQPDELQATVSSENVNCYGTSTGSISLDNISGGSGNYEFTNKNSGPWQSAPDFNNLPAGYYNVQIRDASVPSCKIVLDNSLQLTQYPRLTATISSKPNLCYQDNSGQISVINAAGGSMGNFMYSINGGSTWQSDSVFTNLPSATYNVKLMDADIPSCIRTLNNSLSISQPADLNADLVIEHPDCFGETNGSIIFTNQSGRGSLNDYAYSIDGGITYDVSDTLLNLGDGVYDVRIQDKYTLCYKILNPSLSLNEPGELSAGFSHQDLTCFEDNSGSIEFTSIAGGSGLYNYSIDAGNTWTAEPLFEGLASGNYTLWLRDSLTKTCDKLIKLNQFLDQPTELVASISNNLIDCYGDSNGNITFESYSGGTGPYSFSIDGGSTWQNSDVFDNLPAGTYQAAIKDQICETTINESLVINQNPLLEADVSQEDITCYGANSGKIFLANPRGGNGAIYQFTINGGLSWNTYPGTGIFTYDNLTPGSYDLRMKDAACEVNLNSSLTITEPNPLSASFSQSNITCFGSNDGTIEFTNTNGGFGTYQYRIRNSDSWSGSPVFTNLAPGSFQLSMRDATDTTCQLTVGNTVITEPAVLNVNASKTDINCFDGDNGGLGLSSPSGGYGNYEYSIDGGTNWQSGNFSSLAPGTYTLLIRDADYPACQITVGDYSYAEPEILSAEVSVDTVTCYGGSNGKITLENAFGGSGNYEYSTDGQSTWFTSSNFINLEAKTYPVSIRDANAPACIISLGDYSVSEPDEIVATTNQENVSCNGESNGNISIYPSGGSGNYSYSDDNGGSWTPLNEFDNLNAGAYSIVVRDEKDFTCQVNIASIIISEPDAIQVQLSSNAANCSGSSDGSLEVAVTGGSGTFEYSIDNGSSWVKNSTFENLTAGSYTIQVRDSADYLCSATSAPEVITEPALLEASFTSKDVTCNSGNDGEITLTKGSGENRNLEYSTDNGNTWSSNTDFTGKHAGLYKVWVRNADTTSCQRFLGDAAINQPEPLAVSVITDSATCFGGSNGSITLSSPSGGSGFYEYSYDGQNTWTNNNLLSNLSTSTISISIRDEQAPACIADLGSFQITEPVQLSASASKNDVTCFGGDKGSIFINASGGSGEYDYSIDNGSTWLSSGDFNNLSAGTFQISIRDANEISCTQFISDLNIDQPAEIQLTISSKDANCYQASNGEISISVSGGIGPFEYSIDNGTTWTGTQPITGLSKGNYSLLTRDSYDISCQATSSNIEIAEPARLDVTVNTNDISCYNLTDGSIEFINAPSETRNISYSIDNGATWSSSASFTGLVAGTYNLVIRNADTISCNLNLGTVDISKPEPLSVTIATDSATCFGFNNGSLLFVSPVGGSGLYEYSLDGGSTWSGQTLFTGLPAGSYTPVLRDQNNTACQFTPAPVSVTQPREISLVVNQSLVSCANGSNGSISISGTGGSGSYEYSIDNQISWGTEATINNLSAGDYPVFIRDAQENACIISGGTVTITEPEALSATLSKTDIGCSGDPRGEISLASISGGSGSYEYSYDGMVSWEINTTKVGLEPGSYSVVIRDENDINCMLDLGQAIIETNEIFMDPAIVSDASCFGSSDGSFIVTNPRGGYSLNYEFSNDGGTTWQSDPEFTDLSNGSYSLSIRNSDNVSCSKEMSPVIIGQPDELSAEGQIQNKKCEQEGSIVVVNPSGGSGEYEYTINGTDWSEVTEYLNLIPGTYLLSIRDKNVNSCKVNIYPSIAINELPILSGTASKTSDVSGCIGNENGGLQVTGSAGNGRYKFAFSNGGAWSSPTTDSYNSGQVHSYDNLGTGTYQVKVIDFYGFACDYIIPESITIEHPNADYPATFNETFAIRNYCETEDSAILNVETSHVTAYQWKVNGEAIIDGGIYSGANTEELVITPLTENLNSNEYTLVIEGICEPLIDSVFDRLPVNKFIEPRLSSDTSICEGDTLPVIHIYEHFGAYVWAWEQKSLPDGDWEIITFAESLDSLKPDSTVGGKLYRAYLQNGACPPVYTDTFHFEMYPQPYAYAGNDTIIIEGNKIQLAAFDSTTYSYNWSPGTALTDSTISNPVASPEDSMTFYLEVINEYGCVNHDSIRVIVLPDDRIFIPNTFTPNGDGKNDTWVIRTLESYPQASLEIFNRWGMTLHRQSGTVKPWDGNSNGHAMPTGAYFYLLKLAPDAEPISGSVNIVK